MRIQIQNFRGLSDLTADIEGILLLAGSNGAGKSSACGAIAAAASGALLPVGVTKKDAGLLVHDGQSDAMALINTGDGVASVTWPAVQRATQGDFRDSSAVAVGLEDMTTLKPADRAATLIEMIGAQPTEEQIGKALSSAGVPDNHALEVLKALARGWDAAHAYYRDLGTKAKGAWERATGERFGVAKAASWRPKDWSLALEGKSVAELEADVAARREELGDLQKLSGVDAATRERLRTEAEKLSSAKDELHEANVDHTRAQAAERFAGGSLERLGPKPAPGAKPLQCPCCGALMQLVDGALEAADAVQDHAATERAIAAYAAAEAALAKARDTLRLADTYVRVAQGKVDAAEKAKADLAAQPDETVPAERIAEATKALVHAERDCAMKNLVLEALGLFGEVKRCIAVVELLAPDGLRQAVLVEKLGELNGMLVDCCREASWSPVHIDADMAISYGGRPISLCSAGEQYRARVIVQIVVAALDKSPLLVIDGADILDRAGRNGLLRLLNDRCAHAIVGMTILKREEMPDLARAGIGKSVWIENGTANAQMKAVA